MSLSHPPVREIIETLLALTELRYLELNLKYSIRLHTNDRLIPMLTASCAFNLHTLISHDCTGVHFFKFLESQTSLEVWLDKSSRYDAIYAPAPGALPQISILETTTLRFCSAFSPIHLSYLRLNAFVFDKKHQGAQAQAVRALRACHSLVGLCLEKWRMAMYEVDPGLVEIISDVLDAVLNVKYLCLLRPFNDNFSIPELDSSGYIARVTTKELEECQSMLELVNSKLPRLDTLIFDTISPQSSELALKQDFAFLSSGNHTLKHYICYQEVHLDCRVRLDRIECRKLPDGEVRILPDTKVYDNMSWLGLIAVLEEG